MGEQQLATLRTIKGAVNYSKKNNRVYKQVNRAYIGRSLFCVLPYYLTIISSVSEINVSLNM